MDEIIIDNIDEYLDKIKNSNCLIEKIVIEDDDDFDDEDEIDYY